MKADPRRMPILTQTEHLSRQLAEQISFQQPAARKRATKIGADIRHLVSRTTFGPAPAELEAAEAMGSQGWLDYQLDYTAIDDFGLEELLLESLPTLSMSYDEILDALDSDQNVNTASELIVATIVRQIYSPRQLFELMVEFWTNHFSVFLLDGPVQYLKTGDDRDNIRPHALGRFRDLLHANARSPAMLFYLDNVSNTVVGPNENYARELMELHTLGVDGGYTEGDVKEVARAFTGWTLARDAEELFVFNPGLHDFESKFVLDELLPAGQGIEDGNQVLDLLAAHPSTARFISEKLCRRFVADEPSESIVVKVATTFQDTDGDISAMLRTLLTSEEFAAAQGKKYSRPAEYLASVVRSLGAELDGNYLRVLFQELERQSQVPFFAEPPTGYPDRRDSWLNSNGLLTRWNFGFAVAFGDVPVRFPVTVDEPSDEALLMSDLIRVPIRALRGGTRTPRTIVNRMVSEVLGGSISLADRNALIEYAGTGLPANHLFTPAQSDDCARRVLAALLASPQFQNR